MTETTQVYLGSTKYHLRTLTTGLSTACRIGCWRLQPTDKQWAELADDERCKKCDRHPHAPIKSGLNRG